MKANEVIRRGMNVRDLEAHLKKERMAARKAAERKANPSEELWGNKELREMQLALQEELGRLFPAQPQEVHHPLFGFCRTDSRHT